MQDNFPKDVSHFKLLISDFDGTLVGEDHKVSETVSKAIKRWLNAGKFFTIATGRQFLMIKDECESLGLTTPVIVRGGAEVVNPVNGEILSCEFIPKNTVQKLLSIFINQEVDCGIEVDNFIYANYKLAIDFPNITFKTLSDFTLQKVPKFHIKPKNGQDQLAEELINKIQFEMSDLQIVATHNNSFGRGWDITSIKATKLYGIVKVLEILGLTREETVGVGDSYNDFPLLEAAGLKIAMGNAHDELKEIADVIVPSNEEDGVAVLINKLLK